MAGGGRRPGGARDCQVVEAPWPLALARKSTRQETKDRTMTGFDGDLGKYEVGTHRRRGTRAGRTPQGTTGTWVQAEVGEGGGVHLHGNGSRRRHVARGAGTSGRG